MAFSWHSPAQHHHHNQQTIYSRWFSIQHVHRISLIWNWYILELLSSVNNKVTVILISLFSNSPASNIPQIDTDNHGPNHVHVLVRCLSTNPWSWCNLMLMWCDVMLNQYIHISHRHKYKFSEGLLWFSCERRLNAKIAIKFTASLFARLHHSCSAGSYAYTS